MVLIGVDTGGTFTDFIYKDGEKWGVYKQLSTPENPAMAVLEGIRKISRDRDAKVVHGSTVATNAILERKGVKTALITNAGFEDVIEIGRQNRFSLYDLKYRKEPHIVPSNLRFGLKGRINCDGVELEPLTPSDLTRMRDLVRAADVESIAVCLLFSFLNPEHEKTVRRELEELGVPISLSHEILGEFREFERTSTTVINAYVSPKMKRYITYLIKEVGEDSLRIMQSNGGSISAQTAMDESVRTILSGPAGGAVGAFEIGRAAGFEKLITFDMGGTSTDVALIDGKLPMTLEAGISAYPVKVPMIDIHTVGAGGGSIAEVDVGGSLRVGPESAGADPGPICYGKGERITVTDANLFLGRLVPENFLGGDMRLHDEKLNRHFEEAAAEIGLSPMALAEGILAVANTNMERAIRVISVERGYDPREFSLFSFGGAGGMHCAFLARLLNIPTVFIPNNPGILSAIGMLTADVIKDYSRTVMIKEPDTDYDSLLKMFEEMEERGKAELLREGLEESAIVCERYLDMRYEGQSYELIVPFGEDFSQTFHGMHEKVYGFANPDKVIEIVNIRLRARGLPEKPEMKTFPREGEEIAPEAVVGTRKVVFDSESHETAVIRREMLRHGNRIEGPAILVEYSSTIVVPPFASGKVDAYGNLILEIRNS